jgi:Protein of unknown function (DUF4232)
MNTSTRGIRVRKTRLWGAACAAVLLAAGLGTAASAATSSHVRSSVIPKCTASDLGVWVAADQSNGTAGSIYYPLEFTNLSKGTCYLYGHAGVSAVTATGHQLGQSATWSAGPSSVVNLAPGATAHAMLQYVVVQVSPSCHPVNATELSVIPPDQTSSTHAFWDASSCTTGPVYLGVGVIKPGVGTRSST